MIDEPSIKIFVACHKNCNIIKNRYLIPIQVGSALSNERFNMAHDDNGINISKKNRMYCELTAHYYAWKNEDADFYGFFHYRRYLSFSNNGTESYIYPTDFFDFEKEYGYEPNNMKKIISQYDVIVPCKDNLNTTESLYEHYRKSWFQNIEDLDCMLDIIKRKYPNMYESALRSTMAESGYFCNMFVMKKEIFFAYCEWVFDILGEHEKESNFDTYSEQQLRVSGYLGERLTNIYINWLIEQNKYKILETPTLFFQDASFITKSNSLLEIEPVFEKTDCALVLAANEYYVPYLSALLYSIYANRNLNKNYDIIVLNSDITEFSQITINKMIGNSERFSIRFIDMSDIMKQYPDMPVHGHFKPETYYRFFILDIMPKYKKVLYLDSDMIVCDDISKLYNENVEGFLIGGCKDVDSAGLYNGYQITKKSYIDQILKIKEPYNYFQAGTLLFNLYELRKAFTSKDLIEFALLRHWELLDQDVLNYFCQDHVKYLNMKWNYMIDMNGIREKEIISRAPAQLIREYKSAQKVPSIIHYAGPEKPWLWPGCDKAFEFWYYARKTPFYEIALSRMSKNIIHVIKEINNYYPKNDHEEKKK